jgi:hypothetical protein
LEGEDWMLGVVDDFCFFDCTMLLSGPQCMRGSLYITPEDYVPVIVVEVRAGDGNRVLGFIEDGE